MWFAGAATSLAIYLRTLELASSERQEGFRPLRRLTILSISSRTTTFDLNVGLISPPLFQNDRRARQVKQGHGRGTALSSRFWIEENRRWLGSRPKRTDSDDRRSGHDARGAFAGPVCTSPQLDRPSRYVYAWTG